MYYIIIDLEFNQSTILSNPKCPFEIIQIGALKLDTDLNVLSTFNELIRPVVYTTFHPFVKNLTNIKEEDLSNASSFKDIYNTFVKFIDSNNNNILCTWGMTDIKELIRNIEYHKLKTSLIPKSYIDIQSHASKYLKCPTGTNIGLRNTVEILKIPTEVSFHNALNDAFYTAEIFKKIYNQNITPKLYLPHKSARTSKTKLTLDVDSLLNQFEKMFNRTMTIEEKNIIKLSYMMGKTNQFQIEVKNNKS
ncbi:Inhibitor of the KinA pathway to sporulation, predicted exonuclease [Clostridium cavendishii DSM 21758]|uniref:Inhibitor of the KinA pathway to sporulation, predicted exonuclease n=1 Tax=Clostridium cavendishii DSM 21758 TaxID=1121302 RepID=A0A1M6U6G0_9CLOT|nr:3'-5' exonuclease [Clostridium cavendishii]SHK64865.1 Inhibitor of the KinA pathway to sporulation, predicted exonuclease [Clostridium cavendishii DSM 21758]